MPRAETAMRAAAAATISLAPVVGFFSGEGEIAVPAILAAIAFFAPNTQQIMCRYRPALDFRGGAEGGGVLRFRIATPWMIASVLLLAAALTRGDAISEFLYFQF